MGRKKKRAEVIEPEEASAKTTSFLHSDAKKSIAAVFLFASSLLFILGFFGGAGKLGSFLNSMLGMALGWGKWVFPAVLITAGIFLLQRKQSSLAEILKLTGLLVAFVSLLGFFHMYLDGNMRLAAGKGEGGGYVGFALAWILLKFTGQAAGTIILFTLFLTGLITAFNLSLIHFFERLQARMKREKQNDELQENDEEEEEIDPLLGTEASSEKNEEEFPVAEPLEESVGINDLEKQNIRSIEFVGEKEVTQEEDDEEDEEDEDEALEKRRAPAKRSMSRVKKTLTHWELPSTDLLETSLGQAKAGNVEQNAVIIQKTLKTFGIEVELGEVQTGPTVTQYTFRPALGVKLSRITTLSNDLALALAAHPIRIEAPIPGKSLVGIEVPNRVTAMVRLKDVLLSSVFIRREASLMSLVLGQDVSGDYVIGDLRKMPHLLVAGATNSGKSVCINTLLLSLLYQNSPENLRLILVDPKRVELSLYNKIPHLLTDVITESKKVINSLKWAVREMERRLKLLEETGSRDLLSYNQKFERGEMRTVFNPETKKNHEEELEKLPYIVIVIDEMADLMIAHGKEVEGLIVRLAQMARAAGIHLVLATQRPSVEVITGLIKANIITRIAFQVATQIDSRTILDQGGAEKLVGRGDMLYVAPGSSQPRRLQGVFISEAEVKKVVDFWRKQKLADGNEESIGASLNGEETSNEVAGAFDIEGEISDAAQEDDLYLEAKNVVIQTGKASATYLQRRLKVGYARAARILDLLEENGVVGPGEGAKPREVYGSTSGKSDDMMIDQEKRDTWQV